jgi:sugar phosphate isomerase/epimerase
MALALEFRSTAAFCTNLSTALAVVTRCGEPNVGVNLDVFHYYTGPSKFEDIEGMDKSRLAFVQVSDLAGVPRELARDSDRVLPGDGDFALEPFLRALSALGYRGYISVEVTNPQLWQARPREVAEIARMAVSRLLYRAEGTIDNSSAP